MIQTRDSEVELIGVLYVPEATVNLFSVKRAMDSAAQITFKDSKCYVSIKGALCMEGISKNGLMVINEGRSDQDLALGTAAASQETAGAVAQTLWAPWLRQPVQAAEQEHGGWHLSCSCSVQGAAEGGL